MTHANLSELYVASTSTCVTSQGKVLASFVRLTSVSLTWYRFHSVAHMSAVSRLLLPVFCCCCCCCSYVPDTLDMNTQVQQRKSSSCC